MHKARYAVVTAAMLVAVLLAIAASLAQARMHVTIIEPSDSHHPYQGWVNKALVPVPGDHPIIVKEGNCEAEEYDEEGNLVGITLPGAAACSNGYDEIEINIHYREDRFTFYHELGHIWDSSKLNNHVRRQYLRLLRLKPTYPWWEPESVSEEVLLGEWWGAERFADSYATCAFRNVFPRGTIYRDGIGLVGPLAMHKICRLIRHARPIPYIG